MHGSAKDYGDQVVTFGAYRLDPRNGQLWRGKQAVKLTPKAFAASCYFVERSGQLVTKDDLLAAVWPQTVVSEATLASCIQELRRALRDKAKTPRYIETVHGRGYRFIAPVTAALPVASSKFHIPSSDNQHSVLVGREPEFAQLYKWWEKALGCERQMVFVTGEPGIGKTSLVEAFLDHVGVHGDAPGMEGKVWIGQGQCIEHYGAGEPYLPLLEALGRVCRQPGGEQVVALLAQHAPTWLVQMPALLNTEEFEALQRKTVGATRERMLRELAEAVEVVTVERPLVLWLEDLHWGDVSTLDWLAVVARRRERTKLLVLGTYRPVEVTMREHPLKGVKQELQLHGQCVELSLGGLSERAVGEYLSAKFAIEVHGRGPLQGLARTVHRRTDGNPLFMVNVVDALITQGVAIHRDGQWELRDGVEQAVAKIPESLRQMIARQIERLNSAERQVLEVASVVGAEFSAAAVAAGVGADIEAVEEQCGELVRHEQFLRTQGTVEWPDGTVAGRYSFQHALYQEVLYERLLAGRRQRLHRQIGEREEKGYGEQAREIAAELALHFERGRDYRKAVRYLQQAGDNAVRRSAHQEVIGHLTKGLELLKTLPDTPERAQQELALQISLGPALMAVKGYAAPEVERAYTRSHELCQQVGETPLLFQVLGGLWNVYQARAEHRMARELGEQLLHLAQNMKDPALLMRAHTMLGPTLFFVGEFAPAREHMEQGIALYDFQQRHSRSLQDRGVICLVYAASALWHLGYPDQAREKSHEALALARRLSRPFNLAIALQWAAMVCQSRREVRATQEQAEALISLSAEQGFPFYLASGTILRGWALTEQGREEEGIAQIRQGSDARRATGSEAWRPYFLALLAEAHGKVGQIEEGLTVLAGALDAVNKTEERFYEAELYRLKGTLTLQSKVPGPKSKVEKEAEECFLKAIDIARRQSAKSLELRAVMSLSRLWQQQGKKKQAHAMLAEIYGWFTEGFDTKDLQEAKVLLQELT